MIILASDHAGFELRKQIAEYLAENNIEFRESGCKNGESCDYPKVAEEACLKITDGQVDRGILICGTGLGISMAANKMKGIRAALCTDSYMAKYARMHNDANVLCLGGRVLGSGSACEIVSAFLSAEFEGGRHQRRVDMIMKIEDTEY